MGAGVAEPQQDEAQPKAGLECPDCGCRHFEVVRTVQRPKYIYRRRECRHCKRLVTTSERIVGVES